MKGLPTFHGGSNYQQPFAEQDASIRARLRRVFRGPPKPKPAGKLQYRDEKRYHHTLQHSASGFMKTATTPAMLEAMIK
ncbi:hypothetical protein LZ554_008393 [Drepanopeziza brunnea f. sp. 'monogermtubi']|nr:hypothetical protein LZ554_008393 [Drepanopeziza brunnea f. sp. 'monogermtubi']